MAELEFRVEPGGPLRGSLRVASDKSISHRALMLGAISQGVTRVSGLLRAADVLATRLAMEAMGVAIHDVSGGVEIHGVGMRGLKPPRQDLDMGNSGTGMRLLAGILCAQSFASRLRGDASLSGRPMRRIIEPLALMGASISGSDGRPPLRIEPVPSLRAIEYRSPVASAQVKSCVLLAGLYAHGRTKLHEPQISRDHTERMLAAFGCPVSRSGLCCAIDGGAELRAIDLRVPGDFSSAAFFLVAASIVPDSDILLEEVGINPQRSGLLEILRAMGANIQVREREAAGGEPVADLRVRHAPLRGVDIPPESVARAIDEFPVLFVAAALAEGQTRIRGAGELRVKESDRIAVMARGLRAMGADIEELPDGAVIRGTKQLAGGSVDAAGDHRCAMSLAVAGLRSSSGAIVSGAANVVTSYPEFERHAGRLGTRIEAFEGVCR